LKGQLPSWDKKRESENALAYFQHLITQYRVLMSIGELPRLSRIQAYVEEHCPGPVCAQLLKSALLGLGPRDQARMLSQYAAHEMNFNELQANWSGVISTYKKIGAY
jgi:hypothetical protein